MSLADKVTTETYNFVSFILRVILLGLAFSLSTPDEGKTQYFVHLSFNSTLRLINGILSDLQKVLEHFNGTAILAFFRIPFVPSTSVFPNNLFLYLKDLKLLVFAILLLK